MRVNEIFGPTIQGEGKSAGKLVMFLRLAICNLACIWCDTAWTWNWFGTKFKHPEKHDLKKEIHPMSVKKIISTLKKQGHGVRALVISGGEPMLQEDELIFLIKKLKKVKLLEMLRTVGLLQILRLFNLLRIFKLDNYWIEIETNGTIEPSDEFLELIDQINCSPKTSNSGLDNRLEIRERPEALKKLASSDKVFFKFVVRDRNDLSEIKDLVSRYNMRNVYLMAEGNTREEQYALADEVEEMCWENDWKFSPRYHVLLWNGKRKR